MPRNYVRKREKTYNQEDIKAAIARIEKGLLTIRKASKLYKVPFETLRGNIVQHRKDKPGAYTALSADEEKHIAETIATFSEYGHPIGRTQLKMLVASYLKSVGRQSQFNDGIPGKEWVSFNVVYLPTNLSVSICI